LCFRLVFSLCLVSLASSLLHFGLTAAGIVDRARQALLMKPIVAHRPPASR